MAKSNTFTGRTSCLGGSWLQKGELDKAIDYGTQALALFENLLGAEHPSTEIVRKNLELALQGKVLVNRDSQAPQFPSSNTT